MRPLTEWLELMLAEIRQREEQARASAEEAERSGAGAQLPGSVRDSPNCNDGERPTKDARSTRAREALPARASHSVIAEHHL